jgi:hypothetical protein
MISICSAKAVSGRTTFFIARTTAHHASLWDHESSRVRDLVAVTQFSVLSLSRCCCWCRSSQLSPGSHHKDTPLTYTHCINISSIIMAAEADVDQKSALPRILEGVDISQDFLPAEASVALFVFRLCWRPSRYGPPCFVSVRIRRMQNNSPAAHNMWFAHEAWNSSEQRCTVPSVNETRRLRVVMSSALLGRMFQLRRTVHFDRFNTIWT